MSEELKQPSGMSKKAAVIMAGITAVSTLCASAMVTTGDQAVIVYMGGMATIALMVITHHICQTLIDRKSK